MSLTAGLTVDVPAGMLTDPTTARRLAHGFAALVEPRRRAGEHPEAAFIEALVASLTEHADTLETAYDDVVSSVTDEWFGTGG